MHFLCAPRVPVIAGIPMSWGAGGTCSTPDPFPVCIWVVVGVQRTLGVEASIKKNQGIPIAAGSLDVSGCMLSWEFLAREGRGKNSTSLLFILKRGRDIWILWFAGDAWNCSSFLEFLGWAGKAWEQWPTLHSWGLTAWEPHSLSSAGLRAAWAECCVRRFYSFFSVSPKLTDNHCSGQNVPVSAPVFTPSQHLNTCYMLGRVWEFGITALKWTSYLQTVAVVV